MNVGSILIVEDDESLRRVTQTQLEKLGYDVAAAMDVRQGIEELQRAPRDLVICDINLPGPSGIELLKHARAQYPETTVVMVTAYGTVKSAVDAMKLGAYDYLTKPVHPFELRALVERVLERRHLLDELHLLRSAIDQKFGFENILGQSKILLHVLDSAARAARTEATVLILGETGTGKELLARAMHAHSARSKRPFVVINCGAIPGELLESELFGHVRGAFTGALSHKKGKVEMGDGGTVFLDEIGEMPLDLQVRVLRLIQEREIEKVGASNPISVDVRIFAATHRNLEALVETGRFREDLYYRLAVVPIELPPLRVRSEDIPELVEHFFQKYKRKVNRDKLRLPEYLLPYFAKYPWPGNIRQLQNCIERMIVLCRSDDVTLEDLPDFLRKHTTDEAPNPAEGDDRSVLDTAEKKLILEALQKFEWNQTRAAQQLGVSRKMLISRIAKYGIRKEHTARAGE
jgi:DNA-binding NtrC family response regulator